jgi:hypothetical protein
MVEAALNGRGGAPPSRYGTDGCEPGGFRGTAPDEVTELGQRAPLPTSATGIEQRREPTISAVVCADVHAR